MITQEIILKKLIGNLDQMNFEHSFIKEMLAYTLHSSGFHTFVQILDPKEALPNVFITNLLSDVTFEQLKNREDAHTFALFLNNHIPMGGFGVFENSITLKFSIPIPENTSKWDSAYICSCLAYHQGVLDIYMPLLQALASDHISLEEAKKKSKLGY